MKALRCLVLFALVSPVASIFALDEPLPEIVIVPADVNVVKVVFSKHDSASLEITLTKEKSHVVADITKQYRGSKVRVKIADTVVSEPTIKVPLAGRLIEVRPKNSDEAVRLAKFLTGSK